MKPGAVQATRPGLAVRCTFSPARAWRPAVVARLARTLGVTQIRSATPSVEFYRLLGSLADDVVYAHFHWHLVQELRTSLHERPLVAAQSNVFWYLTTRAHSTTTVQLLSRAFDQEQSSLHLAALLEIVLENVEMFSNESFKSRMAGNPFPD